MNNIRNRTHERGALLIELLIAFALISITLVIAIDAFLVSQRGSRTSNDRSLVTRSLYTFMQDITKEFQVSEQFSCTGGPPCTNLQMTRINNVNGQSPDVVRYRLTGGKVQKRVAGGAWVDLTAPTSVTVQSFEVSLLGYAANDPTDLEPTRALITVRAAATDDPANTQVDLQTTVTSRVE